jgi:hypothetical protein
MSERPERIHHFTGFHGVKRYYDDTRNVNDSGVTRERRAPLPLKG